MEKLTWRLAKNVERGMFIRTKPGTFWKVAWREVNRGVECCHLENGQTLEYSPNDRVIVSVI